MEFVSWDDNISNIWEKSSKCSSHHQPNSELIRILPDGFTVVDMSLVFSLGFVHVFLVVPRV
jgi:hypothetical protein